jgi:hypothetical protein
VFVLSGLLAGGLCNGTIAPRDQQPRRFRVFVIWEPVLPTDFVAPSAAALGRIPDARAVQYWDRQRALSHLVGEHNRSSVVWDYIAVYAPGKLWQDDPPTPIYSDDPVRDLISGAQDSINRLPAAGTTRREVETDEEFIRNMGECSATKRRSIFRQRA